jgi:hypothetical protein
MIYISFVMRIIRREESIVEKEEEREKTGINEAGNS